MPAHGKALSEALGGWLPIETAPKDGARVIVFEPEGAWARNTRRTEHVGEAHWHQPGNSENPGFWVGYSSQIKFNPTHWRPLPPPPTSAHGEQT